MTTALGIAGVTAVLRDLLNDGMINHNVAGILGSSVTVSALPPDRVVPQDGTEASQLNLFLHQVSPNTGWMNEGLPSRDATGRARLSNPPLALNLHYLLSAYSSSDLHGEILLGYAMQLLHEHPVLSRDQIRTALTPSPDVGAVLPPALRALSQSGLADQFEQLRITPEYLNSEEMSKLWTAIQANYRPTAAYQVSVVLIQAQTATRSPLPVLTRGQRRIGAGNIERERGVVVSPDLIPPIPQLTAVLPQGGQPVARLGETVQLLGRHLAGGSREVRLINSRFGIETVFAASGTSHDSLMEVVLPVSAAATLAVGLYEVSASLVMAGETAARETNRLGLVIAPELLGLPMNVARAGDQSASFSLSFRPELQPGQEVSLLLGQRAYTPQPFTAPTATLDFTIPDAPVGNHLARLRVDGVESPITDRGESPPLFLDQRVNIT